LIGIHEKRFIDLEFAVLVRDPKLIQIRAAKAKQSNHLKVSGKPNE
jgi:hypothetical protein